MTKTNILHNWAHAEFKEVNFGDVRLVDSPIPRSWLTRVHVIFSIN